MSISGETLLEETEVLSLNELKEQRLRVEGLGFRVVGKKMAPLAFFLKGLGPLFYILLGFRSKP